MSEKFFRRVVENSVNKRRAFIKMETVRLVYYALNFAAFSGKSAEYTADGSVAVNIFNVIIPYDFFKLSVSFNVFKGKRASAQVDMKKFDVILFFIRFNIVRVGGTAVCNGKKIISEGVTGIYGRAGKAV